jgi:hypothetical protein
MKPPRPEMDVKWYSKTHLYNTFFVFFRPFRPRLALKFAKRANISNKKLIKFCNHQRPGRAKLIKSLNSTLIYIDTQGIVILRESRDRPHHIRQFLSQWLVMVKLQAFAVCAPATGIGRGENGPLKKGQSQDILHLCLNLGLRIRYHWCSIM